MHSTTYAARPTQPARALLDWGPARRDPHHPLHPLHRGRGETDALDLRDADGERPDDN